MATLSQPTPPEHPELFAQVLSRYESIEGVPVAPLLAGQTLPPGLVQPLGEGLINETYPAFVQGFMGTIGRPDVDVLHGLTTAIIVDQERMGANTRSTVGTATDETGMRGFWSHYKNLMETP